MHATLDKTKDGLDNFTISCSEKAIDGVGNRREVFWRELICTRQYLDSTFIERT